MNDKTENQDLDVRKYHTKRLRNIWQYIWKCLTKIFGIFRCVYLSLLSTIMMIKNDDTGIF